MTVNVYDLANELERGIRALPEYKAVQEAKTAIAADATASQLWDRFVASQEKIQVLMQTGQMPSQEDQDEMKELGEAIEGNATVKAYFDAQQRLSVYIQDIERIIFTPLQELAN
ncbi:YlbF/YmcA family competence regulator [Streptococcus caprae]|uniref:UPF0342 protein ACFORF_07910 n=1 Tax=Streptococcus caprae TaxID=1640501 RepID=A0ABV8CWQ2_9STRE